MKAKLLKSMKVLLVAALMGVGVSAWADDVTETYNFQNEAYTNGAQSVTYEESSITVNSTTMYALKNFKGLDLCQRFAVSTKSALSLRLNRPQDATNSGNGLWDYNTDATFAILKLKNGDRFSIKTNSNPTFYVYSNLTDAEGNALANGTLTSEATYIVSTEDATTDVILNFSKSKQNYIYSVTITTANPTVTNPSISSAAGVGYTALTVTPGHIRGNGTGTVVTKYSYVSAVDVKSNGTTYTETLNPTTAGTLYVYSYVEGGDESDVVSFEYEVVAPKLNRPTATFSAMTLNSSSYYKTYGLATDVSNIDGDVSVSYKYSSDQSTWNNIDGSTFVCPAGIYYVKAVADNCDDSDVITVSSNEYKQTSVYKFKTGSGVTYNADATDNYKYIAGLHLSRKPTEVSTNRGLYNSEQGSSNTISIVNALDGQVMETDVNGAASHGFYEYSNSEIKFTLARSTNTSNRLNNLYVYTPVSLIAAASDVTNSPTVDLTGKVLYTENYSAIATAIASASNVCTVTLGQIGYGVSAANLGSLVPSARSNSVLVQLPVNSFYETTTDVANLRTNGGVVAQYALTDAQDYATANAFTATAATYDRSFTKDIVSTICLPFAISAETAATLGKFYQLKSTTNTETVVFEEVTETYALKPYLFVPAATGTITIPASTEFVAAGDVTTQTYGNVTFNGSIASSTISSTIYGFASSGNLVYASSGTMNPFRAYLTTSTPSARLAFYSFDDEATGISGITTSAETLRFYNLQGQSVKAPAKGLYIVNGKKVIIK